MTCLLHMEKLLWLIYKDYMICEIKEYIVLIKECGTYEKKKKRLFERVLDRDLDVKTVKLCILK